jgi:hypothetical protein
MKNRNMKWLSFAVALVMMLTLLVPMAFAEAAPEDMAPDNVGEAAAEDIMNEDKIAEDAVAEDAVAEDDKPDTIFEPLNFVKNLKYMGLGMLGIFIVIGVIIIATALLNKLFKEKKED